MSPDWAFQIGDLKTYYERQQWIQKTTSWVKNKGAGFVRVSLYEEIDPPVVLIEAWMSRPKDLPKPKFFLNLK